MWADVVLPGTACGLRAALAATPCAHSLIDTSRAKAAAGGYSRVYGRGLAGIRDGRPRCLVGSKRRDCTSFRPPYHALVKDRVRFAVTHVDFVVAESRYKQQDGPE